MTVLHSGTTKKYSSNWEQVFGKTKRAATGTAAKAADKKKAGKKPAKAKKS